MSEEEAEKAVEEALASSYFHKYLDPGYERFQVREEVDDRTDAMQRAVTVEVLDSPKETYSKELVELVKRHIFDQNQGWNYKSLKNKFVEKYTNEYPDLYKHFSERSSEDFRTLAKTYKTLEDGPQKEEVGKIILQEINDEIDEHIETLKRNSGNEEIGMGQIYGNNALSLINTFERVPARLLSKIIDFGEGVAHNDRINIKDKENYLSHMLHSLSMTKSDTPELQRFYEGLLPYFDVYPTPGTYYGRRIGLEDSPFKLGMDNLGYAIAKLGENGRQFIPFFKEKFNEVKKWVPNNKQKFYTMSE